MRTITVQCPVKECGWVDHVLAEFDDGPSYLSAREGGQRAVAEHFIEKHNDESEESGSGVTQASEVVKLVEVGPRGGKPKRAIEVVSAPRPLRRRKVKPKAAKPRKRKAASK